MSGDYALGATIHIKFTTRSFSTGVPTQLAGTPSISIYPGDSTTQLGPATVASPAAGITPVIDFDAVTGLNHVTIVATSGNGYATNTDYVVMISAGTVGGVSVVGEVVGSFSLDKSAAAVDLANGTDGLGAIKTDTAAILVDTAEIGAAGAGLTNINLPNQTMDITGNITGNLSGSVGSVTGAVGSVTGNVGGNVTGSVGSVVGAVGSVTGAVGSVTGLTSSDVGAIKAKTDNLPAAPAATGDIPTATQNADALLNRDMSAVTVTNARSPINALRWLRNKWSNSGGTLTVYAEDDTTTAWTAATTTAASDPVDSVDPA